MPDAPGLKVIGGEVYSTCCTMPVEITRAVSDQLSYYPKVLQGNGVLIVSEGTFVQSLDSEGFEVACTGCHCAIDVKVEEG